MLFVGDGYFMGLIRVGLIMGGFHVSWFILESGLRPLLI